MQFVPTALGSAGLPLETIIYRPDVTAEHVGADARYLAISAPDATHRLAVSSTEGAAACACTIVPDAHAPLRLSAAAHLLGSLGIAPMPAGNLLMPTRFQQRRLRLLLSILDAVDSSTGPPATVRSVAARLVYRNFKPGSAIEWKGSSERRQTQRLIAEAKALMNGGYRTLLWGKILKCLD